MTDLELQHEITCQKGTHTHKQNKNAKRAVDFDRLEVIQSVAQSTLASTRTTLRLDVPRQSTSWCLFAVSSMSLLESCSAVSLLTLHTRCRTDAKIHHVYECAWMRPHDPMATWYVSANCQLNMCFFKLSPSKNDSCGTCSRSKVAAKLPGVLTCVIKDPEVGVGLSANRTRQNGQKTKKTITKIQSTLWFLGTASLWELGTSFVAWKSMWTWWVG